MLHAARILISHHNLQAAQIREAENSMQVLSSVRTHPRVPQIQFPQIVKIKKPPNKLGSFCILVESAGIGHPGQPYRLQAICRSQARCMQLETPVRPASRGLDPHQINKNKKPPDEAGWFCIFGGVGGNRTRVQKHSTDSSTYLVLPFDLILTTRTHTLRQDELPII